AAVAGTPDRSGVKAVAADRGFARPGPGRRARRGGGKQEDRAREEPWRDHRPGPDPARLDLAFAIDVERGSTRALPLRWLNAPSSRPARRAGRRRSRPPTSSR